MTTERQTTLVPVQGGYLFIVTKFIDEQTFRVACAEEAAERVAGHRKLARRKRRTRRAPR
jgi:hypothetical protein